MGHGPILEVLLVLIQEDLRLAPHELAPRILLAEVLRQRRQRSSLTSFKGSAIEGKPPRHLPRRFAKRGGQERVYDQLEPLLARATTDTFETLELVPRRVNSTWCS